MIKKIVRYIILFNLLFLILISPVSFAAEENLEDYDFVSQSRELVLYLNKDTSEIAVKDKRNGQVYYSSPQNIEKRETIRTGSARDALKSVLNIKYYSTLDYNTKSMDNYRDSVAHNQMNYKMIDRGIRVEYTFGEEWRDSDYLPIMVNQEVFEEEILEQIEDEGVREMFEENYLLLTLEETGEQPFSGMSFHEFDPAEIFGDYELQVLSDNIDNLESGSSVRDVLEFLLDEIYREYRSDIEYRRDINFEDFQGLVDSPTYVLLVNNYPMFHQEPMIEKLKELGFTPEKVAENHIAKKIDPPSPNQEVFEVPVEYRVEDDNFLATIPAEDIEYPVDVSEEKDEEEVEVSYPLYNIELLRHFGSADKTTEGQIFVPEKTGGLIDFNDSRTQIESYSSRIYGLDESMERDLERVSETPEARLPVFGLLENKKALMGIVEEGTALGKIRADVSGQNDSFNNVYSSFDVLPTTSSALFDEEGEQVTGRIIAQSRLYQGDITVRYAFFDEEKADYSGLANYYRNYLYAGREKSTNSNEDLPFYMKIIGGVNRQGLSMGLPQMIVEPLTSYQETRNIVEQMEEEGVTNSRVIYTGWNEKGIRHHYPDQVRLESKLGTEKDWNELQKFFGSREAELFPEVSFLNIYQFNTLDLFAPRRKGARYLNGDPASIYNYNPVTYLLERETERSILSPKYLPRLVENFNVDFNNQQINNLSPRMIGQQVNSDFRNDPDELIDRVQSVDVSRNIIKKWQKRDYDLLFQGGNSYVLPFADHLINLPVTENYHRQVTEIVPFFQMVLSGYVDYAGRPLNNVQDTKESVLRMLETGEAPYYEWSFRQPEEVDEIPYVNSNSTAFKNWREQAGDIYQQVNKIMKDLSGQSIIHHQEVETQVYRVKYEGGKEILINYNEQVFKYKGKEIKGRDYLILEGGEE